jgi:hypothetical protein
MLPGELSGLQTGTALADNSAGASSIVDPQNPFHVFVTETGTIQTVKGPNCLNTPTQSGVDVCTTSNPFVTENFGTSQGNGQDCETCHQPQLGWSITPRFLADHSRSARGTAEQFRVNTQRRSSRVRVPTAATSQARMRQCHCLRGEHVCSAEDQHLPALP